MILSLKGPDFMNFLTDLVEDITCYLDSLYNFRTMNVDFREHDSVDTYGQGMLVPLFST